jgi:hypothetical protein
MEKQVAKWPAPYVKWSRAGWPVLSVPPEVLLAASARKAAQASATQQHAANQEWDAEGGAIKPSIDSGPKLPL